MGGGFSKRPREDAKGSEKTSKDNQVDGHEHENPTSPASDIPSRRPTHKKQRSSARVTESDDETEEPVNLKLKLKRQNKMKGGKHENGKTAKRKNHDLVQDASQSRKGKADRSQRHIPNNDLDMNQLIELATAKKTATQGNDLVDEVFSLIDSISSSEVVRGSNQEKLQDSPWYRERMEKDRKETKGVVVGAGMAEDELDALQRELDAIDQRTRAENDTFSKLDNISKPVKLMQNRISAGQNGGSNGAQSHDRFKLRTDKENGSFQQRQVGQVSRYSSEQARQC